MCLDWMALVAAVPVAFFEFPPPPAAYYSIMLLLKQSRVMHQHSTAAVFV
jgi:hypothetical protein